MGAGVQLVVDTSALMAVVLEEPERAALLRATRGATLLAPASLVWEVGNALVATVRRRRLTAREAAEAWRAFASIPVRLVEIDVESAIATAIEAGLYAYDAYPLTLAQERGLPLLTLDKQLGKVAAEFRVPLVEF